MILRWYHFNNQNSGGEVKLLTRNTDYAVRAVIFIAGKNGEIVSTAEMIRALKIPTPFLRKILQALSRAGVVVSQRGIGGGFKLARPAERISLTEIIHVFQGPLKLNECLFMKSLCPRRKRCALKSKIDGIERYVTAELESITIGSLIR
ncbi:MAG: Rrf2 family transcriptional regulator [Candidatus Omnitrophota bacterium]